MPNISKSQIRFSCTMLFLIKMKVLLEGDTLALAFHLCFKIAHFNMPSSVNQQQEVQRCTANVRMGTVLVHYRSFIKNLALS